MRMRRASCPGFSLFECLLALALGSVVLGALLASLVQFQRVGQAVQLLGERDRDHQLALVLLARWLLPAGNGLTDPHSLLVLGDVLEVRADLEGNRGFPDGALDDPFENIAVRARDGSLQLRSGNGRFEPFLRHTPVADFRVASETVEVGLTSQVAISELAAARIPRQSTFTFRRVREAPSLFPESP